MSTLSVPGADTMRSVNVRPASVDESAITVATGPLSEFVGAERTATGSSLPNTFVSHDGGLPAARSLPGDMS